MTSVRSNPTQELVIRANREMYAATVEPYTAGAKQVAAALSPFSGALQVIPPAFLPAYATSVAAQATFRACRAAPLHYFAAVGMYYQAALTAAVRATSVLQK